MGLKGNKLVKDLCFFVVLVKQGRNTSKESVFSNVKAFQ